jgi:tetratricopeptide (TPR) repeat protein
VVEAVDSVAVVLAEVGNMDRLETLLEYHKEDPDDSFIRFALASEYAKRGEEATALAWYEGLRDNDRQYVGTYYHLGKLYEKLDRSEEAIGAYKAGIQIASDHSDTHARSELQSALLEAEGIGFD